MAPCRPRKKKKTEESIKPKSDDESLGSEDPHGSEDQHGSEDELEGPKITQEEQDEAAAVLD